MDPDPSPLFLLISVTLNESNLIFSTDINDLRDKFQLKDLQAVIYSYTMDASPEKFIQAKLIQAK